MANVTLKGNAVEIAGNELKVGNAAPDFSLQNQNLEEITMASSAGKTRIIATVPSLDTPVCHEETKRFNDHIKGLDNVEVLVVSMDLPFGQKRWCGAEEVENKVNQRFVSFGLIEIGGNRISVFHVSAHDPGIGIA